MSYKRYKDYIAEEVKLEKSNLTQTNTLQLHPTPPIMNELNTNLENIKNSACEKINKKCANGLCYCFSSDSDDHYIKQPREPIINLFRRSSGAGTYHKISAVHSLSGFSSEEARDSQEDEYEANDEDDEFFTSVDYSNAEEMELPQVQLNSSDSILLRKNSYHKKKRDIMSRKSYSLEQMQVIRKVNEVACQTNEESCYTDSQKQRKTNQAIKITISTNHVEKQTGTYIIFNIMSLIVQYNRIKTCKSVCENAVMKQLMFH